MRSLGERLAAGEILIRQGEQPERLLVLVDGDAEVHLQEGASDHTISRLAVPCLLGEMGILTAESCTATDTSNSGFCNATDTCNPFRTATRPTRARCRSRGRRPHPQAARRVSVAGVLAGSVAPAMRSAIQWDACWMTSTRASAFCGKKLVE
mgnify:CR=1 FL=1